MEDELTEMIDLTKYLTKAQINDILAKAISTGASKNYQARIEIQTLLDALKERGLTYSNEFKQEGTKWTCPECKTELIGVVQCPCGYQNESVMPKGTYKFLFEEDLGEPIGTCHNFACGHPIRFAEHILHLESGKEIVVGNVCVGRLLGEHDLVKIALSLLAKCHGKIDKMNIATRMNEKVGPLLRQLKNLDPDGWFTKEEQQYLEKIENNRTLVQKTADEFIAKWSTEEIKNLIQTVNVKQTDIRNLNVKWLKFLAYKKYRLKDSKNDFIDNCINDLKTRGQLSPGQISALIDEKERFDRICAGDETLLNSVATEDKTEAHLLLGHIKNCNSYFYISMLTQIIGGSELSKKQIDLIINGRCRLCGKQLIN